MRWGAGRRTMLATVVAGVLLAPATGAETLQDAWERASQHDQGIAAVRSQAEAAQLFQAAIASARQAGLSDREIVSLVRESLQSPSKESNP